MSDKYGLAYLSVDEIEEDTSAAGSGDYLLRYDSSSEKFVKIPAAASNRIVDITAGTITLTQATHDDKVLLMNRAAGVVATLPAATGSGTKMIFVVKATVTSNANRIKCANSSDIMQGVAYSATDSGSGVVGWETAADTDTVVFNGTTSGGIAGDRVEVIDIATNLWQVNVFTSSTGTEVSPFFAEV